MSGTIATGYDDFDQRNPGMDLDAFEFSGSTRPSSTCLRGLIAISLLGFVP
jgi:hypothetical protein